MDNIDLVEHIEPKIKHMGHETIEPCLRRIVFQYYKAHFNAIDAVDITDKYFEKLKEELRK